MTDFPRSDIPRRNRFERMQPAELTIREALLLVEDLGSHPLLTEATALLQQAKEKIGDYIDAKATA